jgi:hypothetical protein
MKKLIEKLFTENYLEENELLYLLNNIDEKNRNTASLRKTNML